ncbi:DNA ligase 1-like [Tachysurus vachellii]|uniref:DNA ligase 1-like n=1 Tax=Tachysurus vachellii TaxID=175792 RepID=UPI00296B3CD1|nr:DNA ligase 1-like [Tachysurus vachellii]
MKRLHDISDTKPVVLVVLHHTFDTECVVPDSIKCVNRKNMIAVDCLFHEDKGLLQCLKNKESLDKTSQYLVFLFNEKEQHVKLKKQEQELRKRTRDNEEKDEELNDTDMNPKKMTLSNETQEGTNTPHERNQQLNITEIFKAIVKRNEMNDGDLKMLMAVSEKEKTDLEKENRELLEQLEDKKTQLESVVKELKTSTIKLTEREEQLQKKDKTLEEKEKQLKQTRAKLDKTSKVLEDSQRHVEEKNTLIENLNKLLKEKDRLLTEGPKILEPKGTQLKQEKKQEEEEEVANTRNGKFHKTKPHLELNSKSEEMEHQQVEDITSQQGNENTGLKNNDHLTQEKGTISKATNSELEKNRSSYEGHQQPVLDCTQIQESQLEVKEGEIKNVEKNKELIEKYQNYSNSLQNADAMLMENKEQLSHVTENQQPGVEESNPTEPETQEGESDKQHEEKDRPQLGKTIRKNNQGSVGDTSQEERE